MGIVASQATQLPARAKAAAREQADGRKPDVDRIFQFGLIAHVRPGQTMALTAELNKRFRRKAAGIEDCVLLPRSLDVRTAGAMAALTLYTGEHVP